MSTMIREQIDHRSAWTAAGLTKDDFAFDLERRHLDAFARAAEGVRARGRELEQVGRADFPLDAIATDIRLIKNELDDGHGIVLVRGFPVGDWPQEDIELMYWGLGLHLGTAASQSVAGDRLGHVLDTSDENPDARAYRNKQELRLHTDFSEYVCMLSLSLAETGGRSRYTSAIAVHNEMLRESPRHLEPLYRGYHFYRIGEEGPGELPYSPHRVPVFSACQGLLSNRYLREFIEVGATLKEESLRDEDIGAMDCFDAIAHREDVMLQWTLEPGEATLINNFSVLHAREAFQDDKPNGVRRHLLRLWLDCEDGRAVVPEIDFFSGAGIPEQAHGRPSGRGHLLRELGMNNFSLDDLARRSRLLSCATHS